MNIITCDVVDNLIVPSVARLVRVPPGTLSIGEFSRPFARDLVLHELARVVLERSGDNLPKFNVPIILHFIGGIDVGTSHHPVLALTFVTAVDGLDRVCSRSSRWSISIGFDSSARSEKPWQGETHYIAVAS